MALQEQGYRSPIKLADAEYSIRPTISRKSPPRADLRPARRSNSGPQTRVMRVKNRSPLCGLIYTAALAVARQRPN